jgi:hypothetical protein
MPHSVQIRRLHAACKKNLVRMHYGQGFLCFEHCLNCNVLLLSRIARLFIQNAFSRTSNVFLITFGGGLGGYFFDNLWWGGWGVIFFDNLWWGVGLAGWLVVLAGGF